MICLSDTEYFAAVFFSVSHVMKAEKILQKNGIFHKIIPVPRTISSDCGVCIRFEAGLADKIRETLTGAVEIKDIVKLT